MPCLINDSNIDQTCSGIKRLIQVMFKHASDMSTPVYEGRDMFRTCLGMFQTCQCMLGTCRDLLQTYTDIFQIYPNMVKSCLRHTGLSHVRTCQFIFQSCFRHIETNARNTPTCLRHGLFIIQTLFRHSQEMLDMYPDLFRHVKISFDMFQICQDYIQDM